MRIEKRFLLLILLSFSAAGCVAKRQGVPEKASSDSAQGVSSSASSSQAELLKHMTRFTKEPLEPDETGEVLETAAENFAYGPGLGETMIDITGVVLFPPYALVLAGNTALSLAGYERVRAANLLPDEGKEKYEDIMEGVYSGPGRVVSSAAGEDYRNSDEVKGRWKELFNEFESKRESSLGAPKPSFFPVEMSQIPASEPVTSSAERSPVEDSGSLL